jgi:hypothetical protein
MLSDYELRQLNKIERELQITDPGLAGSLSTMRRERRWVLVLTLTGWAAFSVLALANWGTVAFVLFGLLIPLTFSALAGDKYIQDADGPREDPSV